MEDTKLLKVDIQVIYNIYTYKQKQKIMPNDIINISLNVQVVTVLIVLLVQKKNEQLN